ncbi:hypothetical protein CRM22_005684 [Opisthorchis felineus]|uniref:Uncharacterized protein n=1 Tax=Opisthorchis felineus TaxID=147828 RepID=A0A4V3SEU3_OPIFE|nr:hypothetical protein CRM22_005684 [Opisthorchis felineus]
MVFESLIVDLINTYAGDYIEALNASQLKIGLLGGNAQLENLDIKPNAFDSLNLPVKVLQGHISSLTLKIPFKNLYTEPTVAELDGLYVLVVPNSAVKYDEEKEQIYRRDSKMKELRDIEEARAQSARAGRKVQTKPDSFAEKLAAQIIKNLQVEVKNIHIRYEDGFSIPGQIFSLGFTLSGLFFKTFTPHDKVVPVREESVREFYKLVKLDSLGVYWNHNSMEFSNKARGPLRTAMRNSIASPENPKTGFSYLLQPISSTATLYIHTRPEDSDFTVPQVKLDVDFSEIQLNFSLFQYHDVTSFLDSTDRMITQNKYRKYRPQVPTKGHPSVWWRYAYTAILEESIRRRRRMWSWAFIQKHRRMVRDYIVLWKKQLRGEKFTQEQQKTLQDYEDALDVFNIVLCRQQAELQHNQGKKKEAAEKAKGSRMFRWFSRSPSTSSDTSSSTDSTQSDADVIMKRLQSEMTAEEKARLYEAINYSEAVASPGKFPPTYVSMIISVALRQLSFILLDDKLSDPQILKVAVNKLTAEVEQRSGDQALGVKISLGSLEALGACPSLEQAKLARSSNRPLIISSSAVQLSSEQTKREIAEKHEELLLVEFEKNPLDRRADQRVLVRASPLQIVYDAETINKIVHFLTPPKDIRLQELSSQVMSSLEDVKEVTVSGLRHLVSQRAYTEVQVDVRPSYFILPDNGVFRRECRLLLVDLGSLTVRSTPTKSQQKLALKKVESEVPVGTDALVSLGPRSRKAARHTFEELKEDAYDVYAIAISSMQVIMVEKDEDWRVLRENDRSPSHVLRPLGMNFNLKRCLLHNDINLPGILIDGCLPVFSVDLNDKIVKSLLELVTNVPFPEPDKRLTTPESPSEVLKDAVVLPGAIPSRDVLRAARQLNRSVSMSTVGSWFSDNLDELEEGEEEDADMLSEHSDDEPGDEGPREDQSVNTRSSTLDSGVEGDDVRIKANKAARRMQREAAIRRRRRANLIDLKIEFVVRMIQVQLIQRAEQQSGHKGIDTVILALTVHDVGTQVLKRRWDQELHAHVGTLSVSVPRYSDRQTGEPLCLAKTKRHVEGHHLLAIHLLVAEKSCPDFVVRYNNVRHHLQCEFKSLELCVHQEATLLLIDFLTSLLNELVLPSEPEEAEMKPETQRTGEAEWAAKVGDKEALGVLQQRAALEDAIAKELPVRLTAVAAIEGHLARKYERRVIRIDASTSAAKSGQTMLIREIDMTQWLINATLDKVSLTLCSESSDILSTTIHGLRVDIQMTYLTIELSAILSELSVTDRIESTNYRKILWVDPAESIVSLQLTQFTQGTRLLDNAYNPDKVDMALSLQIGKVHMVFLNHFIMRVVNFMNAFQLKTEAILNKVHDLSDAAALQVQAAAMQYAQFRLSLSIVAQAPVVYMPQHSFSTKALMVDLGCVTYNNHFEFIASNQGLEDAVGPIPDPGIMVERTEIRLDNLRLSRAVLAETSIKTEKPIIHPINFELRMRRNLSSNAYSGIPLLSVEGGLKAIHISLCQGDYRVVQEVVMDNFAEVPATTSSQKPVDAATPPSRKVSRRTLSGTSLAAVQQERPIEASKTLTVVADKAPTTAVRFSVEMDAVTLELFSGEVPASDWQGEPPADLYLALFSLANFSVSGQVATDSSCQIETKLSSIQLTDTRPHPQKQITKVLDHAGTAESHDELIFVEFQQNSNKQQKVNIKLRSIHLCASMDYLVALADFHLKSYPQLEKQAPVLPPITESGKRKRREIPPRTKPRRRQDLPPPKEYPNELELLVDVGGPEIVLVEDIYNMQSNSLKVSATFKMKYNILKDVAVMDASVKGLIVVACPYNEPVHGRFSKEVLSPTEVSFYCKQPINGSMQGSLHIDAIMLNINPGTIQLLGHIVSTIQATTNPQISDIGKPTTAALTDGAQSKLQTMSSDDMNVSLWDPVSLEQLDLPFLKSDAGSTDSNTESDAVSTGCDVSKVLEQMEDRRAEKPLQSNSPGQVDMDLIVMKMKTLHVVLESQIGPRSMPMLILESTVDGEIMSPSTSMELKLSVDLSLSYYNDELNQWEQILETLPDEEDRMWSMQIEMYTTNLEDLLAEEDLDEVGCLQASTQTILLVSRDNMELMLSKSALDMLSKLARSFEAAYKQQMTECEYELGGRAAAPYRIQNRTGWPVTLRVDTHSLQLVDRSTVRCVRKSLVSGTLRPQLNVVQLGRLGSPVAGPITSPVTDKTAIEELDDGLYVLPTGQEVGFTQRRQNSHKKLTIRSMADKAPRQVARVSWSPSTRLKPPAKKSELSLHLSSGNNFLLRLPGAVESPTGGGTFRDPVPFPVVAEVQTHLGMRVICLRSTVQVVNDTSDRLCIYSRVSWASKDGRPGRLATIEPGEIYALPIEIVNSQETTGIFIGPDLGVTTMSTCAAYWPETACSTHGNGHYQELVYLSPLAERSGSTANTQATLQTVSEAVANSATSSKSRFNWPVQFIKCKSNASSLIYYYTITTMNGKPSGSGSESQLRAAQVERITTTEAYECYVADFQMLIRNSVVLHNQLPIALNYILSDGIGEIPAGNHFTLRTVNPSRATVDVWFEYDNHVYRAMIQIAPNMDELTVVTFKSREGYELLTLHLGLRNVSNRGQVELTLYAPYWMINKTGKNLTYKSTEDMEVNHPASFQGALLFSSLAKSVFGKRKASVKMDDSNWSDKFSLDTVGSSGRVNCKTKQKWSYEIGVKIDLSSSGLTKIVTLMPYFMLVNKSGIDLECNEVDDTTGDDRSSIGKWIRVPAGEAVPFWPRATTSKKMLLRCRITEHLVTNVFPFYESHSILMKLPGKYAGVFIEVQTTEEATVITLQLYQDGMALVRLVNHLGDCQPVYFQQRGVEKVHQLDAGMSVMYAWDCPQAERELLFYCNKNDRPQSNKLTVDTVEEFYVNDTKAFWVSFLWNMQRVLLFTQDVNAAKNARLSADLEKIEQEIVVSLQSIGLSLVDNHNRAEVAYLSITSSGVRWSQVKRGNRLKPLKVATSDSLERAYATYVEQLRVGEPVRGLTKLTDVGRPVEVDFGQMMMLQPDQCELRRAFEPGVFLQYKTSASQMQIHAKIFRIQLDNQKLDCTFPVVLAPYPQPKSVALDSGPKPLIELSAIIARTANPGSFRFKYFRVLIQEMMLKLDHGFLNDMFDFFSGSVTRVSQEEAFKQDYQLIQNRLMDSPILLTHLQDGNRSVFDNFHISPIKMHVSFSLTGSSDGKNVAFPSEVLNLFLQSLGVALTDVQDVIFKLAYFEHQACIMTVNQMLSEMMRHYVSQGIRQMYVLVLGLDVLGNPFGVLRGMAQGVEDLFYEPVKGAVLGPEEFAEGVALGVKSLFGHAVGGAAGAVSRITGTLGKGVAALTLDEDYKRRRREQLARRPDSFGAGLAQGGRGLVMGVYHGLTGVLVKPVEGAKKEGVEGFFKGFGKGLIGVVARPVSGVVDFASSSFEGIRRIADTVEDVARVRPPRYIQMDGIIRPYERRQAEGHLILQRVNKDNNYGHYVFHISASKGNNLLLLTTTDLLIAECMDLLGTWTVHWNTKLDALAEVPLVNRNGILITLKEKQKKMFTSGHQTKQFDCATDAAMAFVREVDLIKSKRDSWGPHSPRTGSPPTLET